MVQKKGNFKAVKVLIILALSCASLAFAAHDENGKPKHHHKHKHHKAQAKTRASSEGTLYTDEVDANNKTYGDHEEYSDEKNPFYQVYTDEQGDVRVSFEIKTGDDYYKKIEFDNQRLVKREKRPEYFPIRVYDRENGKEIFEDLISTLTEKPANIINDYNGWINRTLTTDFGHYFIESKYAESVKLVHEKLVGNPEIQFKFFRHLAAIFYAFHAHKFYPASYPTLKPGLSSKSSSFTTVKNKMVEDYGEEGAPASAPSWLPSNYAISRIFYNTQEIVKKEQSNHLTEMAHVFIHSLAIDYYMRNQIYFSNHPKRLSQYIDVVRRSTMGGNYQTEANAINFITKNQTETKYAPFFNQKVHRIENFFTNMNEMLTHNQEGLKDFEKRSLEFYKEVRSARKAEKTRAILKMYKNNKKYFQGLKSFEINDGDLDDVDLFIMTFLMKMEQEGPNYLWREVLTDMSILINHKDFDFIRDQIAGLYFNLVIVGVEDKLFNPNDDIYLANLYHLFSQENYIRKDKVNGFVQAFFTIHGGKLDNENKTLVGKFYKTPKDIISKMMTYVDKSRNALSNHDWEAVINTINIEMGGLPDIQ